MILNLSKAIEYLKQSWNLSKIAGVKETASFFVSESYTVYKTTCCSKLVDEF